MPSHHAYSRLPVQKTFPLTDGTTHTSNLPPSAASPSMRQSRRSSLGKLHGNEREPSTGLASPERLLLAGRQAGSMVLMHLRFHMSGFRIYSAALAAASPGTAQAAAITAARRTKGRLPGCKSASNSGIQKGATRHSRLTCPCPEAPTPGSCQSPRHTSETWPPTTAAAAAACAAAR
jgi:hypothetical protein